MYSYKLLNDSETIRVLKNAQKRLVLPSLLGILGLFNILVFLAWYKIEEINSNRYIYILGVIIVFQIILFIFYYKKLINKPLEDIKEKELRISFLEEGIKIIYGNLEKQISWNGVKEIKVYEDYLVFFYRVNGLKANIFIFNCFDDEKEKIVSEIEKYKEVRWN